MQRVFQRATFVLLVLVLVQSLTGCKSKFIEATLENRTSAPLRLITVEYPHASFGTQQLAAQRTFHYRFKLLGSGPIKLTWTDAANKEHVQTGPEMLEGQEGELHIVFSAIDHAVFETKVRP